jgi:hypothetical protein
MDDETRGCIAEIACIILLSTVVLCFGLVMLLTTNPNLW